MNIKRPTYSIVPVSAGLTWLRAGWHCSEKMDGVFHVRQIGLAVMIGELMKNGEFFAFDLLNDETGQDLRHNSFIERFSSLLAMSLPTGVKIVPVPERGEEFGAFLSRVLAAGGEGVVFKPMAGTWGDTWTKCKRVITERVIVTDFNSNGKSSVRIGSLCRAFDRGWMPIRGEKLDQIRVGSILKIEAFGYTGTGLFREARLDKDTETSWLVKY